MINGKLMIKHAAIKKDNIVYVGHRHANCIQVMSECLLPWPVTKDAIQGFVTDSGEFVDRKEGFKIALACNQIIKKHGEKDVLYS